LSLATEYVGDVTIPTQVIKYNQFFSRRINQSDCSVHIKLNYTSIICSKISNIPYNFIFTAKFNDSSILITIISCDYLNLSLANEYVGDITIPTQVISIAKIFSSRISHSGCSIHIKLQIKLFNLKSI